MTYLDNVLIYMKIIFISIQATYEMFLEQWNMHEVLMSNGDASAAWRRRHEHARNIMAPIELNKTSRVVCWWAPTRIEWFVLELVLEDCGGCLWDGTRSWRWFFATKYNGWSGWERVDTSWAWWCFDIIVTSIVVVVSLWMVSSVLNWTVAPGTFVLRRLNDICVVNQENPEFMLNLSLTCSAP